MLIEINNFGPDATSEQIDSIRDEISDRLSRFEIHLTRVEAYFKDTNGSTRQGIDKQCKLEARLKSQPTPVVVSAEGATAERALREAADKLTTSLSRTIEKLNGYHHDVEFG